MQKNASSAGHAGEGVDLSHARATLCQRPRNPLRRWCASRARNAGWCDLSGARATLCGDRACRAREMQARVEHLWSWKLRIRLPKKPLICELLNNQNKSHAIRFLSSNSQISLVFKKRPSSSHCSSGSSRTRLQCEPALGILQEIGCAQEFVTVSFVAIHQRSRTSFTFVCLNSLQCALCVVFQEILDPSHSCDNGIQGCEALFFPNA